MQMRVLAPGMGGDTADVVVAALGAAHVDPITTADHLPLGRLGQYLAGCLEEAALAAVDLAALVAVLRDIITAHRLRLGHRPPSRPSLVLLLGVVPMAVDHATITAARRHRLLGLTVPPAPLIFAA